MTLLSKNVYIDKLDDIVRNKIIHTTEQLRQNLLMLKIIHILILKMKLMIKILSLKLAIMEELQNTELGHMLLTV